jgi:hypothetical protein
LRRLCRELERERTAVEDDKAQVDRFKQLLLKQRDIMLACRHLNDRDEQILTLQGAPLSLVVCRATAQYSRQLSFNT